MAPEQILPVLGALANETRLRVVNLLLAAGTDGRMTPTALADALDTPRNLVSSHLAVLAAAELVTTSRTGRNVGYGINRAILRALAEELTRMTDHIDD